MNNLVSIKVPVLNALDDMGIDIAREIPVFTRWAIDAEKEIGSYYSMRVQRQVLTIDHCRAELPCSAVFMQGLIFGDYGCECADIFERCFTFGTITGAAVSDSFVIIDATTAGNSISLANTNWEVQGNHIVFSQDYDGQKITIQYLGYECDDDGFIKAGENHILAITEYIMYKFCIRSQYSTNKMTQSDIQRHFMEWNRLCSHARAEDARLSETSRAQIVAMLHNPFSGIGLSIGMHSTQDYLWQI